MKSKIKMSLKTKTWMPWDCWIETKVSYFPNLRNKTSQPQSWNYYQLTPKSQAILCVENITKAVASFGALVMSKKQANK